MTNSNVRIIFRGLLLLLGFALVCGLEQSAWADAASLTPTEDPIRIGVGARPMGMGKAFVALADDASAALINPAGLADLQSWQALSMYSNLLGDVSYVTLGFDTPVSTTGFQGVVGATTVTSGVGDILSPKQSGYDVFSYRNDCYLLSVASKVTCNLNLGANLKLFSKGFSGSIGSSGTGMDIDLGAKYTVNDYLGLGVCVQNALPASMGGKITWDTGHEENIPALCKYGLVWRSPSKLILLTLDQDVWVTRKMPSVMHLGIEGNIDTLFSVRCGIDQITSSAFNGAYSNPTFGIGLNYGMFRVDYAYHPYYEESSNVTHFVSISLSPDFAKYIPPACLLPAPASPEVAVGIIVNTPANHSIIYTPTVEVQGTRINQNINTIKLNNLPVALGEKGEFSANLPLFLGKNDLNFLGLNAQGITIENESIRVSRLKTFMDVADDTGGKTAIESLTTVNIMWGGKRKGIELFNPAGTISRAEMAVVLTRALLATGKIAPDDKTLLSKNPSTGFKDVKGTFWAAPSIAIARQKRFLSGFPNGTFQPNQTVTRLEAIVSIAKAFDLPLMENCVSPFIDLPTSHWAAKYICSAKEAGTISFLDQKLLQPNKKITRAEIALMLDKTNILEKKVNEILGLSN